MNKTTIIKSIVPIVCTISFLIPLSAKEFPGESWSVKNPDELGIDASKVEKLFDLSFQDDATQSVVLIKDGYIIAERYADGYDKDSIGTSWSMAKSFYASLIGISIERGEIGSLDDKVSDYLDYFNEDRKDITIREVLDMTSGLENPDHEHEIMFFKDDHLSYAKDIKRDKETNTVFEYNNINSLLLGDILLVATGKKADDLLKERVLDPIGTKNYVLWRDAADNVLSYCCIDMSARDYSRFGQSESNPLLTYRYSNSLIRYPLHLSKGHNFLCLSDREHVLSKDHLLSCLWRQEGCLQAKVNLCCCIQKQCWFLCLVLYLWRSSSDHL